MTLALELRQLWRRKALLLLGILVAAAAAIASVSSLSGFPPKPSKGTLEYYSARTQILIDSNNSTFADLSRDLSPMIARANVFSRFLTTPTALRFIGADAKVPPNQIYAQGPYQLGQARFIQEPTAERQGSQLVGRKAPYRLRFDSDPELPIVTVYAEAPTGREATALANGTASGLSSYIQRLQDRQQVRTRRRVEVRQLGSTSGASVTAGADKKIAAFVFMVVLGLWCLAMIALRRVAAEWRAAAAIESSATPAPAEPPGGLLLTGARGPSPESESEDEEPRRAKRLRRR